MSGYDLVDIDVEILHETDRALKATDGSREVWLPKSQLHNWEPGSQCQTITLPEWLAQDKGLV